jgi:hypothetical protein
MAYRIEIKSPAKAKVELGVYEGPTPAIGSVLAANEAAKIARLKVIAVHPGKPGATGEAIDIVDVEEV